MRHMVCNSCWSLWPAPREQKTNMAALALCAVCGEKKHLGGPIGIQERNWLFYKTCNIDPGPIPELFQ